MKGKMWIFILMTTAFFASGALWLAGCKGGGKHSEHAGAEQQANYHCPMHPTYVSDKPGDCPICGMRLVPIESEQAHEKAVTDVQGSTKAMEGAPADRATVSLPPERQQLIGVRSAPVTRQDLEVIVRASGRVAYDPDLYNAIVEYREALKARESVKDSAWPDVRERSEAMIQASNLRLRQMGLSHAQIEEMSAQTENPTNLLLSKKGGLVWVYAQIYEYETGMIKAGQVMEVTSSAFPGQSQKGRVVAVDTILNAETRTLRVRGEISNDEDLFRPEMYVDVAIYVGFGRKLAVPEEAVLDTGTRRIVFVEAGPGVYEPREVKLGRQAEDHYEVLSGLKEGEKVVTSANFLIDSESRLKAALSQSGAGGGHSH